jgi:hypothetical protein
VEREKDNLEKAKYDIVSRTEEKIRSRCERKAEDLGRKWGSVWADREKMGMMNMSGEEESETFDQLGKMAEWLEEKIEEKKQEMLKERDELGRGIWGYSGRASEEPNMNRKRTKVRVERHTSGYGGRDGNRNGNGERRLSPR